jgi:hypothetical protein
MNSSGDLPILRYKSCFMASCNTGRTFSESFTHGTFLYSMDDTNGLIGKNGKIEGDLYTERNNWEIVEGKLEHSLVPASWGMKHYVRLLTEGKTWTQICTFMNENQWWDEGKPPRTNQNYKHHPN